MDLILKDKPVISFNTRRMYTEHGQRIAATTAPGERVVFVDIDRGIYGVSKSRCALDRMSVMWVYDTCDYVDWYANDAEERIKRDALRNVALLVKSGGNF